MSEPDLSFVEPERREEIARRIAEVENYLKAPGREAAERAAARLGLGLSAFQLLVRVWKSSGRAEELSGATRRRSVSKRPNAPTPAQLAIIRGTEAGMPEDVLLEKVVKEIYANAASLGAPMPTRPTIRRYAASYRRDRLAGIPAGVGIAVDHCAVDVPVRWDGSSVLPIATLVLDLEARAVLGVALDPVAHGPRTTALALLDAVSRIDRAAAEPSGPIPASIDRDDRAEWGELFDLIEANGLARSGEQAERLPGGQRTIRLIGKSAHGISFRARTTHRKPGGRVAKGFATDPAEAQQFLRARLIRSVDGGPLARLTEPVRTALALDLRRFVEG